MKMNTATEEEVNGCVVGDYLKQFSLFYETRKQGSTIYARSAEAAKNIAEARISQYRKDLGASFEDIYPRQLWHLREYDA